MGGKQRLGPAAEPPTGASTDVEFTPRTKAREVVGRLLVACLCGLAVAAYAAFEAPDTLTVGLAAVLLVLTLALWAIRAASPVTRLAVRVRSARGDRGRRPAGLRPLRWLLTDRGRRHAG